MNSPHKNKLYWVTGGAGYLGSAITRALDAQGAKVLCFDLAGRAEDLVTKNQLTNTIPVTLNISDNQASVAAMDELIAMHGVPDGLAHLPAGASRGKSLEELQPEDFTGTFDRALTPTFIFCRAMAERMKPRGHGSIVLFASMYGMVAPDPRIYHRPRVVNPIDYGALKGAVLQLSRYLAVHYGPAGLRFNCITPGPFPNPSMHESDQKFIADLSEKTPLARVGSNEEIVGPTLFLLSDGASFVTGHSLVVDGGWTAW